MKIDLKEVATYFINLDQDFYKKSSIEKWLNNLGFKPPIRIPGIIFKPYYFGLADATINAIQFGLKNNSMFLVFEDDAMPILDDFDYVIEVPDDADAVWLGFTDWGYCDSGIGDTGKPRLAKVKSVEGFDNVYKAINVLTTHAVLYISPKFSLAAIESFKTKVYGTSLDIKLVADGLFDKFNIYAVGPLFYQNDPTKQFMIDATKNVDIDSILC